jgi:hypothetical protein
MISVDQALSVWAELEDAYRGDHSYGGHTAEIYAYRLMPMSPLYLQHSLLAAQDEIEKLETDAAADMYLLLEKFRETRRCVIEVNGEPLSGTRQTRFTHRWHVRIAVC